MASHDYTWARGRRHQLMLTVLTFWRRSGRILVAGEALSVSPPFAWRDLYWTATRRPGEESPLLGPP
uniref:Uncharacterized protein n=1 Tax=Rhizophora mucronata TaxID=61149 RepID=A0A2P2P7Y0_RHIMU